jgi:hypothetical protein
MDIDNFESMELPAPGSVVYVIGFERNGFVPVYVGTTVNLTGRLGGHALANFRLPSDFKLGEAISYLQERGHLVVVRYRTGGAVEEAALLGEWRGKYMLLNDLAGYDYRETSAQEQRVRVREFIDGIIGQG